MLSKKTLFLLIGYFISLSCFAQNTTTDGKLNRTIDSLLNSLKTAKEDTNKVNTLNNLSKKITNTGDYEKAKKYANDALILSQKIKPIAIGFKKGKANAYNIIGNIYYYQGNYPEALKNYFASLKIRIEIGDKKGISASYNNIGIIYEDQANYREALKNHYASLKIRLEIDDKQGIAYSYNNIGIIYQNQSNYSEAFKQYSAALKIQKEIGDKQGVAASYNNIGVIYEIQGNRPKVRQAERDSLFNLALKSYLAFLKINEDIGDKNGIATSCMNIGTLNTSLRNFSVAEKYLNQALNLSREIGSKLLIKSIYSDLAELDSTQGNWKAAYEHHNLYIIYRDSLNNEETKEKTIQTSMSYEFEKKEALTKAEQVKKDALAAIEIKKQQIIRYAVSGILILVVLFTFFLYNRFRLIRKQKNIIELKEKETHHQKQVVEEKHQLIISGINAASLIQEASLPPPKILNQLFSDYFILYKPKDIVSGDFYWVKDLGESILVAVVDCTGHGVPGAFMALHGYNLLERIVAEKKVVELDAILNELNIAIVNAMRAETDDMYVKNGMDMAIIKLYKTKRILEYSGAKNDLYLVRDGVLNEIKSDKMSIGHIFDATFTVKQQELKSNDMLFLYTDGYKDQKGGIKNTRFMVSQFKQILQTISVKNSAEQKEILENTFKNWKNTNEQTDDVCVVGIKII